MLLNNISQRISCSMFYQPHVVVQFVWIAAFLVSTKFEHFRYDPPVKKSYCFFRALVISTSALFCTLFSKRMDSGPYRCRSPPSDFDFAYQLKKSKLEELPMKEINLRDYYPFYTSDVIVEVPDEVALLLREYALLEEAYRIRTYRYRAFYSLEGNDGIEREALNHPLMPDEILEQRQMSELIFRGLATLSEKQRHRIYAHFFLGMSKADIARAEGSSVNSVKDSIRRGLRSLEKFFERNL